MDKSEIMAEARRIRTLALSELPDEDCCTLLQPRHAETRARVEDLRRIEARLDVAELAAGLAESAREHRPGTVAPPGPPAGLPVLSSPA
jgi:thiamine biosynthesis protein ThiI